MAVVFGDYRATGLTSRLNLDLSLSQLTKEQLTTPSLRGETILNASKFKSYCFYMTLELGLKCRAPAQVCLRDGSHHHGNARSLANFLLELAHRDTVNDM